jgi:acyl-CoA synthetase (AMP-forming)/AMP-acid ligase II
MSVLMQRPVNADISLKLCSWFCRCRFELSRRFEEAMQASMICEGYGSTEATCLVSINAAW